MSDPLYPLLESILQGTKGKLLWIVDTKIDEYSKFNISDLTLLTHRVDLYNRLPQQQTELSDFDYSIFADKSIDTMVYRIAKEKPVVHHLINQALRILKPDGRLLLIGNKAAGIKTYIQQTKKCFLGDCHTKKIQGDLWLAEFTSPVILSNPLDDKNYPELRVTITDDKFSYWSKPGVYGWNKIDKGSAYLIENLDTCLGALPKPPERLLDLGCGYGYLSLNTSHLGIPILATDSNVAAIAACQKNFSHYHINGTVMADDCAQSIIDTYPLILCNPPFHNGIGVDNSLTDKFLQSAHKHLTDDGVACFVTNLHIPLEQKAQTLFKQVTVIAANKHFKIICLSKSKSAHYFV